MTEVDKMLDTAWQIGACGCLGPLPNCPCKVRYDKLKAMPDHDKLKDVSFAELVYTVQSICEAHNSAAGYLLANRLILLSREVEIMKNKKK